MHSARVIVLSLLVASGCGKSDQSVATPKVEDRTALEKPAVGVKLEAAPAATTPELAKQIDEKPLDRRITVGTDTASIYLYHPDDLKHRLKSPYGWERYGFACGKEFAAGRLVVFTTGGDGGYPIRATNGQLTERERKMFVASWDFRLRVQHGKVCFDGGDHVPNVDFREPERRYDRREWLDLPNGDYRVEVSEIDNFGEPGMKKNDGTLKPEALASYVVRFERVEKLEQVQVRANTGPRLDGQRKPEPDRDDAEYKTFTEAKEQLGDDTYVVVE